MDFKKVFNDALEAAKPSIIGLFIVTFVIFGITHLTTWSTIAYILGLLQYPVYAAIVLFAGYRATKTLGRDIKTAAAAGALAALVQFIVWMTFLLITSIMLFPTGQVPISPEIKGKLGTGLISAATLVVVAVFWGFLGIVSAVVNAFVGAVGGFIGQKLK
jgi:hypothetical protein